MLSIGFNPVLEENGCRLGGEIGYLEPEYPDVEPTVTGEAERVEVRLANQSGSLGRAVGRGGITLGVEDDGWGMAEKLEELGRGTEVGEVLLVPPVVDSFRDKTISCPLK